jgi:methionyl aminopeptidase
MSSSKQVLDIKNKAKKVEKIYEENENNDGLDIASYKKAGQIAAKVKEFAKNLVKPDMLLSEIANKIEDETLKLGGEVAFPVNLSIDDVAAHYTPTLRDEKKASGLLKVDFGVHFNGCIADLAFSVDLTPEKKYQKQIESSEKALKAALEEVKKSK